MNQLQTPFVRNLSLNIVTLAAGALLLLAMSVEILTGDHRHFSQAYLWIQFAVCIVFLADFFIRLARSERRTRFFLRNLLFLLLSIPYLNLVDWFSLELARGWAMLIGADAALSGFSGALHHRRMARQEPLQSTAGGLSFFGAGLHLSGVAGLLRLRDSGQSPPGRLRRCTVVGLDERHDGRGRDLPRHGRGEGRLRAAAHRRHDLLPDLHGLHFTILYGKKEQQLTNRARNAIFAG